MICQKNVNLKTRLLVSFDLSVSYFSEAVFDNKYEKLQVYLHIKQKNNFLITNFDK